VRRTFHLVHAEARRRAVEAVQQAPEGFAVTVEEPKRNLSQNALMWTLLSDVAEQVEWHGQKLSPENWKDMCSAALKAQRVVPGIDGGFVVLGARTSRMTKSEMSEMIEFIYAFGAQHGVTFDEVAA
jgi:hypothetical protein